MITIYTKDNCQQCKMTLLHLANIGITDIDKRNVDTNERYLEQAKATGYTSMPIVVQNGSVVASGFQPDKLNELKEEK